MQKVTVLLLFQQVGTLPHYYLPVRKWLIERFRNRYINRRGIIEWLPKSTDLNPLEFFLWGYLISIVYEKKIDTRITFK